MSLKKQLDDVHLNLNKSFNKLEYHKETLQLQAERVKEQIINNISIQIDALNQRKDWLVNQLNIVKCDKMDSIQRQQNAVKCSMLNINKIISDHNNYTHFQIKEEFENINNILREETRPFLAFKSDSATLRESISLYGTILKQYSGHFADPTRPSISLPRVVEEEDDEENLSFTRKYESTQNENDSDNVLYISKHATNSSIVRAWLMTTNPDDSITQSQCESPTKPDQEFHTHMDLCDSINIKKTNDELAIHNECKDLWLPKNDKVVKIGYGSEPLMRLDNIDKIKKTPWLLGINSIDDERDLDHFELVKKMCKCGNCKSFYDCCETDNCFRRRLIDSNKPFWNKLVFDNEIVNSELLNTTYSFGMPRHLFTASKFAKVINIDNENWFNKNKYRRHIDDNINHHNTMEWGPLNKISMMTDCFNDNNNCELIYNPIDKLISPNWRNDKIKMTELLNKTIEKISLNETEELVCTNDNLNIDCNKWVASR